MAEIEQNLREIARAKGLRLSDIADRMGTTVSNLLSSVKGNPTASKLQGIAEALGVGVSELLTLRPESARGLVILDGKTWQLAKPSGSVVQIPTYDKYDVLRGDLRLFIAKAVDGKENVSMMGLVETMEFFCLVYDSFSGYFYLSLCYADSKMMTITYDIAEFCDWDGDESKTAWNVGQLTEEIINDIEGAVPARLRVQAG